MDLVNLFAIVLNFSASFYLRSQYLGFNSSSRLRACCKCSLNRSLSSLNLSHTDRGLIINKLKGPLDTVHFALHSVFFSLDAHLFLLFFFSAQECELEELLSNLDVILVFFLSLIWMQNVEQKFITSSI